MNHKVWLSVNQETTVLANTRLNEVPLLKQVLIGVLTGYIQKVNYILWSENIRLAVSVDSFKALLNPIIQQELSNLRVI